MLKLSQSLFFVFVEVWRRWGICCSAWLNIDMYSLGEARVAGWLPSRPQCDRAVSTWRWPSPWTLHSAQFSCQVLQATWSIKHLNDDHSFMHSHTRPLLLHISVFSECWIYLSVSVCFLCTNIFVQRSLTCIQLVSEGRFWLDLDAWWNKSPLGFKGGYFEQAILHRAFTLNKSTNAPMFQNTAFTASCFISISCTVV